MPYKKKKDKTTQRALLIVGVIAVVFVLLARSNFMTQSQTMSTAPTPSASAYPVITINNYGTASLSTGSIDWGTLQGTIVKDVYIQNAGSNALSTINIAAENWSPSEVSQYLTFTWSYASGQQMPLQPGGEVLMQLQLSVDPNIQNQDVSNFGFTIVVTAS